jgi:MOSC domain-containing protein YiiM
VIDDHADVGELLDELLRVTQPRYPCFDLGIRMGDPLSPRALLASGRIGFYLRVLPEGEAGAGDAVGLVERSDALTVEEWRHLVLVEKESAEGARLALRCQTLAWEWREPLEERLRQEDARQP